jgi:predicted amidohydrolase YtcJ
MGDGVEGGAMITRGLVLLTLLGWMPSVAVTDEVPAELALMGGVVLTLEESQPEASALAVRDGRIVAVGGAKDIGPFLGPKTRRVDLAGRLVLPGFTDAHAHVESLGGSLEVLDLVGTDSLEAVRQRVVQSAPALPPGEWLLGRGWDQNDWPEPRFPSHADLDAVAADRPVWLTRIDGHAGWANSAALARAGISASTQDPSGGRLVRDDEGRPTGVLIDAAMELVETRIPRPGPEVRRRRLQRGLEACAEAGITSVHDAGVDPETVRLYKELLAAGRLPVRVYAMLAGPGGFLAAGRELRPEVGLGDGMLTVRAVKLLADGALGSRGALLLEPYADEPARRGLLTIDKAALEAVLRRALDQGFQVCTHAIGDGANRLVLDAYEKAFGSRGGASHRFRIEHAQVVAAEDVARFARLGVIPSVQPTHCTSDMGWAGDRLGPERVHGAYRWRSFLELGLPVAGGSDAPVESVAVLPGLYAAVTRQDAKGRPTGGFEPQERVSLVEALSMFTKQAAFAAFEEEERGSIIPGKRADLTVLDRDVTKLPPESLLRAKVALTLVGGRPVFGELQVTSP